MALLNGSADSFSSSRLQTAALVQTDRCQLHHICKCAAAVLVVGWLECLHACMHAGSRVFTRAARKQCFFAMSTTSFPIGACPLSRRDAGCSCYCARVLPCFSAHYVCSIRHSVLRKHQLLQTLLCTAGAGQQHARHAVPSKDAQAWLTAETCRCCFAPHCSSQQCMRATSWS